MTIPSTIGKIASERRAARMKRGNTCYTNSLGMLLAVGVTKN